MEEKGQEKEPWNYQNDGLHIGFRIGMHIIIIHHYNSNRINRKITCETEERTDKNHTTLHSI